MINFPDRLVGCGGFMDRLALHGIHHVAQAHWNLSTPELIEHALRRGEGKLADNGALVVTTGPHTGRSPQDKFIVEDSETKDPVKWGTLNKPFDEDHFNRLHHRLTAYLQGRELYVTDCLAGADPLYSLRVRVINELAWRNLFCKQLLLPGDTSESNEPEFTIIDAPSFKAHPEIDSTRTGAFIILNITKRLVIIGGTQYAGEMKKSVFSILNFLLPLKGVM